MNNIKVLPKDGQAPARRFGSCVAFFVILFGCLCLISVWAIFVSDNLGILKTSGYLQSKGEVTQGTIVDFEMHSGVRPTSSPTRTLIVEYAVDGKAYTVK